jgi:hypothetical protein
MKNLRIVTKEITPVKLNKEEKKTKIAIQEDHTLKLSREEIELIKKGLHLEEMSICEILNDDILKYQHQLSVIKDLYNKLDAAY